MNDLMRGFLVCCCVCSTVTLAVWPAAADLAPCNKKAPEQRQTKCLDVNECRLNGTACQSSQAWTPAKKYSKSCTPNAGATANCIRFRIVCVTKVHCKTVPLRLGRWKCKVNGNVKDPAGDDIVREVDVVGHKSCVVSG